MTLPFVLLISIQITGVTALTYMAVLFSRGEIWRWKLFNAGMVLFVALVFASTDYRILRPSPLPLNDCVETSGLVS